MFVFIIFLNIRFQCDSRCMKVKKLTKEEEIIATTDEAKCENEDHWLPETAIPESKNSIKPKFSKEEIAKKRTDRRKFEVSLSLVSLFRMIGSELVTYISTFKSLQHE